MKLFYRVAAKEYRRKLEQIRDDLKMHEEIDEEHVSLRLEDQSQIERIVCTFDPNQDEFANVRIILNDDSLQQYFDSILGTPYKIKS